MKIGVFLILMCKCVIIREMTEVTAADLRHAGITSTEAGARPEEAEMEASEAAPSSPTGTGTRPTMTTFDLCFLYYISALYLFVLLYLNCKMKCVSTVHSATVSTAHFRCRRWRGTRSRLASTRWWPGTWTPPAASS